MGKSTKIGLYQKTFNLLGKKFKLGSKDPSIGLDCFTLIIAYFKNCGIEIKDDESLDGFNFKNYKHAYLEEPSKLMEVAIKFIETKARKIPMSNALAGDILLIKNINNSISFGIDIGNGFALSISETDGVISLSKNDFDIIRAYRCRV